MNFDELKPGPELDKLIAERVMGLISCDMWRSVYNAMSAIAGRAVYLRGKCEHNDNECYPADNPREYSSDIACAWQVIEHLKKRKFTVYLFYNTEAKSNSLWRVGFRNGEAWEADMPPDKVWSSAGEATTVPLAICIAALKAVENGN